MQAVVLVRVHGQPLTWWLFLLYYEKEEAVEKFYYQGQFEINMQARYAGCDWKQTPTLKTWKRKIQLNCMA